MKVDYGHIKQGLGAGGASTAARTGT